MQKEKLGLLVISFLIVIFAVLIVTKLSQKADYVTVLLYHSVINQDEMPDKYLDKNGEVKSRYVITTENFEKQMDILKKYNYKTLTLDEFHDFVTGKRDVPKNSVLITFDDGLKNQYVNAYPILKKHHFKAASFLMTSKIAQDNEEYDAKKGQYISQEEIDNSKDVFEYASHTHKFHKKTEGKKAYLIAKNSKEIKKDLKKSFQIVDKKYLAYPYGVYDKKLYKLLRNLEVKCAFTNKKGKVKKNSNVYAVKRNNIKNSYSEEKFKKIVGIEIQ